MLAIVFRKPLLVILLGAFLVRAAAGVGLQHLLDEVWDREFLIEGDAAGYWELAVGLAEGREYAVHDPPRHALRMPGFPAVLAISIQLADWLGAAGQRSLVSRILLAAVGTLACWLVYRLGRELFDESIGLWACFFTAISPTMIVFSVVILSETLFAAGLVASLLFMAKLVKAGSSPEHRWQAVGLPLTAGAMIAVACYVRPSWLLAGPLFVLFFVGMAEQKKQAALRGGLVLLALAAALAPWAMRNQAVLGHWVWTTTWVGPSLYDGLNPQATGDSDMQFFDDDRLMERMSEYEVDRHYRREAWRFVVENPGRTLELALVKLVRYWSPVPNAEQFTRWWIMGPVAAFFVPMLVLAVRGGWVSRRQVWAWGLAAGPILYFAAIHAVFVGSLRYRLPAEYPLYVLSAVGIQSWWITRKKIE